MVNIEKIKKESMKNSPENYEVDCILELKDSYIVLLNKFDKNGNALTYGIAKKVFKNGTITDYSTVKNPKEFKIALKNLIYKR